MGAEEHNGEVDAGHRWHELRALRGAREAGARGSAWRARGRCVDRRGIGVVRRGADERGEDRGRGERRWISGARCERGGAMTLVDWVVIAGAAAAIGVVNWYFFIASRGHAKMRHEH